MQEKFIKYFQETCKHLKYSKYPVVSIKNGVASALKDIKHSYNWLDKFDNIVINFDNDSVGREASQKVAELFQPGKVKIVKLSESYKDANDLLRSKIPRLGTTHMGRSLTVTGR